MTEYQQWLATLKPGDSWRCVTHSDFCGAYIACVEVIRLTNTQIVCKVGVFEHRFRYLHVGPFYVGVSY